MPRSFSTFLVVFACFCLLLPQPRPDHNHENDRDCNDDCSNFAGMVLKGLWDRSLLLLDLFGIVESNACLFLVFGALSADGQQTLRCLMVVNGMFSRPQSAGALEGHRSTMQTLHETSLEWCFSCLDCQSLFGLGFLNLFFRLHTRCQSTPVTMCGWALISVDDHPKALIPLLMGHQVGIRGSQLHTVLNEPLQRINGFRAVEHGKLWRHRHSCRLTTLTKRICTLTWSMKKGIKGQNSEAGICNPGWRTEFQGVLFKRKIESHSYSYIHIIFYHIIR